jgi:hypothetical protein
MRFTSIFSDNKGPQTAKSYTIDYLSRASELGIEEKTTSFESIKESKVSKKFSEQTTKRVVLIVLVVVMCEYLLSSSTYVRNERSYEYAADVIFSFNHSSKL